MRILKRALFCVVLIAGIVGGSVNAWADHPPYLILQTPTAKTGHRQTMGYSPGYGYGAQTHGYSYGWFGAQPRQHWSRSFGVNRSYTQWSAQ
jgi:hypothetical protein